MPSQPRFASWLSRLILLGSATALASCATVKIKRDEDAVRALEQVCAYGAENVKVAGSVWIKASSSDAKGQFPAEVEVKSSNQVLLEVTNLIGETQAKIRVDGDIYKIDIPGKEARVEEGSGSWGGIPLEWSTALFLGRFPCPSDLQDPRLSVRREVDDVIVAELHTAGGDVAEEYYYRLKSWAGKSWPEELTWTRPGEPVVSVVFRFDKPDPDKGAPLRWEAKSDRGEVNVRWRRRNVEKTEPKS